ncbi:hypothetical protein GE09DRAFT_1049621 [Coniochaeta sp. 2T2.1]|nr:hypothetical protein GE09DRAFT_1049621 [Coniochaeta sp. 2T2.1]
MLHPRPEKWADASILTFCFGSPRTQSDPSTGDSCCRSVLEVASIKIRLCVWGETRGSQSYCTPQPAWQLCNKCCCLSLLHHTHLAPTFPVLPTQEAASQTRHMP